jgi:hypothetical protein
MPILKHCVSSYYYLSGKNCSKFIQHSKKPVSDQLQADIYFQLAYGGGWILSFAEIHIP